MMVLPLRSSLHSWHCALLWYYYFVLANTLNRSSSSIVHGFSIRTTTSTTCTNKHNSMMDGMTIRTISATAAAADDDDYDYDDDAPPLTRRDVLVRSSTSVVTMLSTILLPPTSSSSSSMAIIGGNSAPNNEEGDATITTSLLSATWNAVDGLNSLDSQNKFVSFQDSAYQAMIHDSSRTPLFEKAIQYRLSQLSSSASSSTKNNKEFQKKKDEQEVVVLDLGTGPYAYFAIIAARYGATKVYAIEASKEAAISARRAVQEAGYDNIITILEGYSTDIPSLPDGKKADLVIAEIVGSVASEEGAYATILDAKRKFVKYPNNVASWIPHRIQTYAAPASYSLHNLFLPPEFDWTKLNGQPVRFNCRDEGLQLLSDPVLVEDFSFSDDISSSTTSRRSSSIQERKELQEQCRIKFIVDGNRIHDNISKFKEEYSRGRVPNANELAFTAANSVSGIALWPRLLLLDDDDKTTTNTTTTAAAAAAATTTDEILQVNSRHFPDGAHQRSHWQTVLPIMSPEPVEVKGGDEIVVDFDFHIPLSVTTPPSYKINGTVFHKQ